MADNSSVAAGCIGLIAMVLIGSCVFAGGASEKPAQSQPEPTSLPSSQADPAKAPDASRPDRAEASAAEAAVAFIIGLNGYHCIKVIDAYKATSTLYDVTCITDHHGNEATYMVNAESNEATPI